jgi:organic hydroperoxide reductase OsmC/OhrA
MGSSAWPRDTLRCRPRGPAATAKSGVTVVGYEDQPTGLMIGEANGAGQFDNVTVHPTITITLDSDARVADELHHRVADYCFIARSIQTPICHVVTIKRISAANA